MSWAPRSAVLVLLLGIACDGGSESSRVETPQNEPRPSPPSDPDVPRFDSVPAPPGFPRMLKCGEAVVSPEELTTPPTRKARRDAISALLEGRTKRWSSHAPKKEWRVLARTDRRLVVVAGHPPGLLQIVLARRAGQWEVISRGGCTTEAKWGNSVRAEWELDPEFPPSGFGKMLHLLIVESACRSGIDPRPRLETPRIVYGDTTVTVALFVRPPPGGGAYTCIGPPPVPIAVELAEPIGERELLDGAVYPAQPPTLPW